MDDRQQIAVLLDHSSVSGPSNVPLEPDSPLSSRRRAMLERRRAKAVERLRRREEDEQQLGVKRDRERAIKQMASLVEVGPALLLPPKRRREPSDTVSIDLEEEDDFEDEGIGVLGVSHGIGLLSRY